MSFTVERVDPKEFGDIFKSSRKSELPKFVEALSGFKVGETGMFPFSDDDDREKKESYIRRAAGQLGLGISLKLAPGGKHVAFLIKTRTIRARKPAGDDEE